MKTLPQARVDVQSADFGSEVMIYDPRSDLYHFLNATARQIWQLCDGSHGIDDMVDDVLKTFPQVPETQVRRDVERVVQDFVEKGLVVWAAADDAAEGEAGEAAGRRD